MSDGEGGAGCSRDSARHGHHQCHFDLPQCAKPFRAFHSARKVLVQDADICVGKLWGIYCPTEVSIMKRAELELEFTGAALGWAAEELEFSEPEISQTLGVDRKTVHRWRRRESVPGPEQRKQVEKLSQLKWLLNNAFRTPEIGKRWLYRPAPGLGGKTPAASLLEGKIDSVIGVLATHISGAYV